MCGWQKAEYYENKLTGDVAIHCILHIIVSMTTNCSPKITIQGHKSVCMYAVMGYWTEA